MPLEIEVTDQCREELSVHIPMNWTSANYGVQHFLKAVEIWVEFKHCLKSIEKKATTINHIITCFYLEC